MKNLMFNKNWVVFLIAFLLVGAEPFCRISVVCSQPPPPSKNDQVHVVSDKMVAQKDTAMVEFIGHVKATSGDSIVYADSIKIYFMDGGKNTGTQNNVKKIVSTGNVKYTAGKRNAIADKAVYTTRDRVLVLTGNAPKLITGSSFVIGKKITLFRENDKVVVESDGTKRVEAFFNPEDNITDKQ
ncbi:LptA/OstA family protein [Desulfobacula sp.]|uniref:LptA/OstA family protein n=1 Tax=Desulfobacula sp. TaxID=2593537 RepID=UPI00261CC47E|nr:LptA/OstA family protein [Desulfobacula sp.]